jgi:hypothetical protein
MMVLEATYGYKTHYSAPTCGFLKLSLNCPQEVIQSAGTTLNEAVVISSNSHSPLLCEHVKNKK